MKELVSKAELAGVPVSVYVRGEKMELFGSDPRSLYLLNQELATRVYTAPSLVL